MIAAPPLFLLPTPIWQASSRWELKHEQKPNLGSNRDLALVRAVLVITNPSRRQDPAARRGIAQPAALPSRKEKQGDDGGGGSDGSRTYLPCCLHDASQRHKTENSDLVLEVREDDVHPPIVGKGKVAGRLGLVVGARADCSEKGR